MMKTIEMPDLEIPGPFKDNMKVFVRKNEVLFDVSIDSTGCEFVIPITKLLEILGL